MDGDQLRIGDFVTVNRRDCRGVVYRVDEIGIYVSPQHAYKLRPVFGLFGAVENRGYRTELADMLRKLTLVDAGIEHVKMQNFIRELARHEAGA